MLSVSLHEALGRDRRRRVEGEGRRMEGLESLMVSF